MKIPKSLTGIEDQIVKKADAVLGLRCVLDTVLKLDFVSFSNLFLNTM